MQRKAMKSLVTALVSLFISTQFATAQDRMWLDSADEAAELAARSGKMIVISIGADWCHYCKKMDRETWRDVKIQQLIRQSYVPLKLTDEQHHQLIKSLQVSSFPTTFIFTSDRTFLTKMEGFVDAQKMAYTLERIRIADSQRSLQTPPIR